MITKTEFEKIKNISIKVSSPGLVSNFELFESYGFAIAMLPELVKTIDSLIEQNKNLTEKLIKIEEDKKV